MAGHTTNINLAKPTYSEDADIAVINSNMDIIDGKMGAVGNTSVQAQLNTASTNITNLGKELCAVVAGKQSTTGAATGEYVIVRGSTISGISDGAYIAAKTIPANTNLDSSYFSSTGMTKGIANALNTNANRREVQKAVYSQLKDNGDLTTSTLTAYPTTPGLFRVGAKSACPGLPADSNGYGPLLIFNAGGYVLHVHKAANGRMWYGYTENAISAPSSWIEIAQNDKIAKMLPSGFSASSDSDLKDKLTAKANTLSENELCSINFYCSYNSSFLGINQGVLSGILTKYNARFFEVQLVSTTGIFVTISCYDDTWTVKSLKDEIVVCATLNGVTIPDGTASSPSDIQLNVTNYMPSGYELYGATVYILSSGSWYSLPWTNNNMTTWLKIDRIAGKTVFLKNASNGWGTADIKVSLFLKKS